METVQRISKPNLVDLLRMCDRHRWCTPRIRYASIRSLPCGFFRVQTQGDEVRIVSNFPDLRYNLKERRFYLDGQWFDAAKVPVFHLERKKTVLEFGPVYARAQLGSGTASVSFAASPLLRMSK